MNLTTLTNKEIFKLCHSTAKKVTAKLGGHYSANFTLALRAIYTDIRAAKAKPVVSISATSRVDFLASDALINRSRYTPWEREFLGSVAGHRYFSAKQQAVVDRLYAQHA